MIYNVSNICRIKVKVLKSIKEKERKRVVWVWWYTPLNPTLGRQRYIDLCDFKGQR